MPDEVKIEAMAREISCHLWATVVVNNSDDCDDFDNMPAYVREIYRKAVRAVLPIATADMVPRAVPENVAELVERVTNLQDGNAWPSTVTLLCDLRDMAMSLASTVADLERENTLLAAGQCIVERGIIGDERGHFECQIQKRVADLERQLAEARGEQEQRS